MKNLVKTYLTAVVIVMTSSALFGQTVTLAPSQAPKGAYVNGSDGDQQWLQVITYTVGANNATWPSIAGTPDITIILPDSMNIADTNQDGSYTDEVTVWQEGALVAGNGTPAATSSQITVDVTAGAPATGDVWQFVFPVTTTAGATGSQDYSFVLDVLVDETTLSFTPTVTYLDTMTVATFGANYVGNNDATSTTEGLLYPTGGASIVAAPIDLVNDLLGSNVIGVLGNQFFGPNALDATNDNGEVTTTFWASMTPSLTRVNGTNAHQPLSSTATLATDGDGVEFVGDAGATPATYEFNAQLLAEGYWFFYVTSSATGDWAIASSDSVNIQHWPTFAAGNTGGGGFDYDVNGTFDGGAGADGIITSLTLESGGTLGKDGALVNANNLQAIDLFWSFNDVDDDATIQIFRTASSGLPIDSVQISGSSPNETVTGVGSSSTELTSSPISETSATPSLNYDIYTDASTFEPAGTYYIYYVVNDGKNQNVYEVEENGGPTPIPLVVKHYPFFRFDDVYLADAHNVDSGTDDYYVISWGSDVNGDLDADHDATITFYYTSGANSLETILDAIGGGSQVIDASVNEDVNFTGVTTLIASTTEDPDGLADNRYMWNFAGLATPLAAATDHRIIAHIQGGTDELLVQYTAALGPIAHNAPIAEDRDFQPLHSSYLRIETPLEGETVTLGGSDEFEVKWTGFDKDGATTDILHFFIAPAGIDVNSVLTVSGTANTWTGLNTDADNNDVWLADWYFLNGITGGSAAAANNVGADISTGTYTLDVSDLTTDMDGTTANPSGFYSLWYVETYAATFNLEVPAQAAGVFRFTGSTASATSFNMTPNSGVYSKGDTISVSVNAQSAGALNVRLLTVEIDVPDAYFTVLGGATPFTGESVNLNGTVLTNEQASSGGVISLSYVEKDDTPSEALNGADLSIASFQVTVDTIVSGVDLLDQLVTFVNSGTRLTGIIDQNGNSETLTLASPAATYRVAPSGGVTGQVAFEIIEDNGETVEAWVTPTGSYTPITDADFLAANGGANSDGSVTVTLGVDGAYTLAGIPTGDYDIKVHKDYHLDQLSANVQIRPAFNRELNFTGSDMLLAGDISGYDDDGDAATAQVPDNQIQAADITAVSDAFGTTSADAAWYAPADLDGDGTVYIVDYNTIVSNSGTNGEGPVYKGASNRNEGTVVNLIATRTIGSEVTYSVELDELSSLHAYAIEIDLHGGAKVVSSEDGIGSFGDSRALSMTSGNDHTFASALVGRGGDIRASSISIMSFTVRGGSEAPSLASVTLIDGSGRSSKALVRDGLTLPGEFSLRQNFPNPFNPTTNIEFSIARDADVRLSVYNLIGQEVATLVSGQMAPGSYKATWNATDFSGRKVSTGLYFYRLVVDSKVLSTKKMMLLK